MTTSELLDAIQGRAPKQKDFSEALSKLATSKSLENFLEANDSLLSKIRPSQVADQLLLSVTSLLDARMSPIIAKNVYDEYAVIFMLGILTMTDKKTERNGLVKVFRMIIANTSKFDMYIKTGSRSRKISSANYTIELFWLIPLLVNIPVLLSIDQEEFIRNNEEIRVADADYVDGYYFYATGSLLSIDKDAYKQFLSDGVVALSHSKAA